MTVYFCITFSGVGEELVRIGYPCRQASSKISLYIELCEHLRNIREISSIPYVKNQSNMGAFIIDWIIRSCMNIWYMHN